MFYQVVGDSSGVIDCFLKKSEAIREFNRAKEGCYIVAIECEVNSETIRALLSGQGGYAVDSNHIKSKT